MLDFNCKFQSKQILISLLWNLQYIIYNEIVKLRYSIYTDTIINFVHQYSV